MYYLLGIVLHCYCLQFLYRAFFVHACMWSSQLFPNHSHVCSCWTVIFFSLLLQRECLFYCYWHIHMPNTTAMNGLIVAQPAQSHDHPQPQCNLHPFLHMFPIHLNLGLRATTKHLPLFTHNKDPSSQSRDEPTWMMTGGLVNEAEKQQERLA